MKTLKSSAIGLTLLLSAAAALVSQPLAVIVFGLAATYAIALLWEDRHRASARLLRGIGWCLSLIGAAAAAFLVTGGGGWISQQEWGVAIAAIAAGLVAVVVGLAGRRVVQLSEKQLANTPQPETTPLDSRAPVLYLRSFQLDSVDEADQNQRTAQDMFPRGSFEQRWVRQLELVGPVVGLRNPALMEQVPGATRVTPGADWRADVRHRLSEAQLVVVVAGATAGLLWELQEAASMVAPIRMMILVPEWVDWPAIRTDLTRALPAMLPPATMKKPAYIYFDEGWIGHGVSTEPSVSSLRPVLNAIGIHGIAAAQSYGFGMVAVSVAHTIAVSAAVVWAWEVWPITLLSGIALAFLSRRIGFSIGVAHGLGAPGLVGIGISLFWLIWRMGLRDAEPFSTLSTIAYGATLVSVPVSIALLIWTVANWRMLVRRHLMNRAVVSASVLQL